jgi:SAM-dependent methyltransferase
LSQRTRPIQIIDYEGSSYKTDFWEGQGREFEDLTERQALRRLLPPTGNILVEVGAGFGRLADLYANFEQVVLVDYSTSLLAEARERFGHDPRYRFVAANVYSLPFVSDLADVIVMIRVAHHLEAIDVALAEIHRVLHGESMFIMEFANKRNAKAMARYLFRRQSWSPFDQEPYEFVPLNFDFHPRWMEERLRQAGFQIEEELAISNFRLPALKKRVSPQLLARIDNMIAGPGAALKVSPSILTRNRVLKAYSPAQGFFQCPQCGGRALQALPDAYHCPDCQARWPIREGILDFRHPRPAA